MIHGQKHGNGVSTFPLFQDTVKGPPANLFGKIYTHSAVTLTFLDKPIKTFSFRRCFLSSEVGCVIILTFFFLNHFNPNVFLPGRK